MSSHKKIGLFGFGTVGKGFYEILKLQKDLPVSIKKVCIKRLDLERIGHELYFTDNVDEILQDPDIDIVIEVIDDAIAAKEIVLEALEAGKSVISANKKMIAESLTEVDEWHQSFEQSFLYEAAVAGAIPIINTIESSFKDYQIKGINGILNGSSNYILTKMQEEELSFEKALSNAQKLGFAESDPTLDIAGFDASYKLAILAYHAFGDVHTLENCTRQNIAEVTNNDIKEAKSKGIKIKPVASVAFVDGILQSSIKAQWLDASHELFHVDNEFNAVALNMEVSGHQTLVGKGAGSLPTGSAVFSDLKRLLRNYKYQQSKALVSKWI